MILIYPPVSKPCEPPAGLAQLAGTLRGNGIRCRIVDGNFEGMLSILSNPPAASDRWTSRAARHLKAHVASLGDEHTYANRDRYKRAVMDVNRILTVAARHQGITISLGNYQDAALSPVRSSDLVRASETPETNPFYPYFSARLRTLIEEEEPRIIGFSLTYLSQALCTFAMIGYLKSIAPEISIVVGGGLATSWIRNPEWNNPFGGLIDRMVAGPGEAALLSLAGRDYAGDGAPPDYDDFAAVPYLSPGFILPYSASRGCYWNRCSFCPERAEGNAYQPVPVKRVTDHLARLTQELHPSLIHIVDNAISPRLLEELALHPPGAPWYGFVRVLPQLADADFCRALKVSGCAMLKLGIESGDQDVLDSLEKGIEIAEASRALTTLKAAGIATYVYLLFGTPAETEREARRTLEFTVKHKDAVDFLNVAIFNLPAHSIETETVRTGDFYDGDLSLYRSFIHPRGWDRKKVRHFVEKEFKKHPAVAPIMRNDPPIFTSNHAPYFAMME
jgi:hypothetical protein